MRKLIGILSCAILLAGCASDKTTAPKPGQPKPASNKPVITPDFRLVGKVARVNPDGRFVVLSFSPGQAPKPDEVFNIYRNGLKVAEVKVDSKWQNDNNAVADIVAGEVQVGDEARQN
jgi:PBP1b-binding outer membrane lipoprotein LpoB